MMHHYKKLLAVLQLAWIESGGQGVQSKKRKNREAIIKIEKRNISITTTDDNNNRK